MHAKKKLIFKKLSSVNFQIVCGLSKHFFSSVVITCFLRVTFLVSIFPYILSKTQTAVGVIKDKHVMRSVSLSCATRYHTFLTSACYLVLIHGISIFLFQGFLGIAQMKLHYANLLVKAQIHQYLSLQRALSALIPHENNCSDFSWIQSKLRKKKGIIIYFKSEKKIISLFEVSCIPF